MKFRRTALIAIIFVLTIAFSGILEAAPNKANAGSGEPNKGVSQEVQRLLGNMRDPKGAAAGHDKVKSARTVYKGGYLRSLGAPADHVFTVRGVVKGNSRATAKNFISEHGKAFGVVSKSVDFAHKKSKKKNGRNYERFSQTYSGLPVFGGEMIVQLDDVGGVQFVLSDILTDTSDLDGGKISMTPGLSAGDAAFLAADLFVSEYPNVQLENTVPQLMIYQPEVVGNSGSAALVWHTVIRSVSIYVVDEVVLVDAHTGEVALRYSQIKHAKDREIYDADSTAVIQGELARAEGDAPANQEDVDDCYDFLGDTYDFYELQHGRDSIDDDGITMIATVRFCPDPSDCPFANAVWAGFLTQMIYGEGWAVDDIVAHELTHGVTESESGLIYLNESGAINESFSDMWGEWVDLTNDPDDPEDRWLLGEDSPFGAFRDMADPTEFNHPDSKCSQWWYTGRGDNGGVHINSGVGNKLCYLLTDGDRFKGVEIVALNPDPVISISRVADLMYEAQTNLLTEASEYADLYVALTQAAVNLGWSDFEKFNLEVAAQVTELSGVCFDPANLPVFVDMMPPAPNPTQWDVEPQATGIQSIYMEAVGATDDSGVEYFFECLSDPSFSSNGWQDSSTYIINSPDLIRSGANDAYSFKVKARDKSDYQNETDYTPVKSVTLDVGSDTSSPAPDPARWALPPTLIRLEPSPTIRMSAQSAYDETGPAEYFFKCTAVDPSVVDMSIFDSGWQSSTTFTSRHASLIPGSTYTFVVIARDALGHETEPSVQVSVTLTNGGPTVLTVPEPYATIQDAIDAADTMLNSSPDALITVEVRPGTYSGNGNRDIDFKGLPITVRSVAPDDALTVAATIIDCGGQRGGAASGFAVDSHRGFVFQGGEGPDSILAGFTITNGYISVDGPPASGPGSPGNNGDPSQGGGIRCTNSSSPTIQNCIITDCGVEGGWGSAGADGDPTAPNGGKGGEGGLAAGGAIYADASSRPSIIDCEIESCYALGGQGGSGGNGADADDTLPSPAGNGGDGSSSGLAFGGGIYIDKNNPGVTLSGTLITNCSVSAGNGGDGGNGGNGGGDPTNLQGGNGGDAGNATNAVGGGVACDNNNLLTIFNCNIDNNTAQGAVVNGFADSGIGGTGGTGGVPGGADGADGTDAEAFGGGIWYGTDCSATIQGVSEQRTVVENNLSFHDGGGIYAKEGCSLELMDCDVNRNTTSLGDGGGIWYAGGNTLTLEHCNFEGNIGSAESEDGSPYVSNGGAVYAGSLGVSGTTVVIQDSNLESNSAGYGGAVHLVNLDLNAANSTFHENVAWDGGGLWIFNCNSTLKSCSISDNFAFQQTEDDEMFGFGYGGGLINYNGSATLDDCVWKGNSSNGSGGAMYFEGFSSTPHVLTNCLMTENQALITDLSDPNEPIIGGDGGAISSNLGAWLQLTNCTISGNEAFSGGGLICAEEWAWVELFSSILWDNEAPYGPQIAVGRVGGSIFEPTAYVDISYSDVQGGPDDIFEENNSTIAWWLDGNINQDPLFTYPPPIPSELEPVSPEGFYLSQVAAGQSENSPCLNGGLGSPEDLDTQLGFKGSTRTDLIAEVDSDVTIELDPPLANPYDPDVVNMGYHYNADKTYNLTIRVESLTDFIAEPAQLRATQDGIDFVTATTTVREVSAGVVDLEAIILDSRYELVAWGNADDDASTALINTVTMNQDKTVIMVCDTINPLLKINIIGEGTVTTMVSGEEVDADMTFWDSDEVVHLEARPDNASESVRWTQTDDDALLSNFNQVTMTESKTVTVRFYEPTIRNVTGDFTDLQYAIDVAEENDIIIVHPGDYDPVQGWQFVIDKNIVIQGYNPDSLESVENTIIRSSFILESTDRSMVINGISIQDNTWVGGDGCPGADENCGNPLPDGDNGVDIEGVGITFLGDASATIKNCKIRDNIGIAGNGGDGGNVDDICGDGGWGGWARGAGVYIESGDPRFIRCDFIDNRVQGGGGGDGDQSDGCVTRGGSWDDPEEPYQDWDWPPPGGYQNFWKYSGYGGAVYCDENSRPEFSGCSFRGNIAEGGHTGRGSGAYSPIRPPQNLPDGWYKIDRYGGAVFVADGSQVLFTECVFENNEADTVGPLENYKDPARSPIVEEDPYFSYGGAIALEDDLETKAATVVTLKDCVFESGTAHHGGGVYAEHATLQVTDSDFTSNVASFGGAIYNVDSDVTVENTSFTGNAADITESQGGAVFAFDSNSVFTDVVMIGNSSGRSGGGFYLTGGTMTLHNALIVDNNSIRDGAGLSANWYSEVDLSNCTFDLNRVEGTGGISQGGAIFAGYQSYVDVNDCILWNNSAGKGAQIAISAGLEVDPVPSIVTIAYSDILYYETDKERAISVDEESTLNEDTATLFSDDPEFEPLPEALGNLAQAYYLDQNLSPCIDAGSRLAFDAGLSNYTTSIFNTPDRDDVDLGYHYRLITRDICSSTDLIPTGDIDLRDWAVFASEWLTLDVCGDDNDWCNGTDFNFDKKVDFDDLLVFVPCWLRYDSEPPYPSPSEWANVPTAVAGTFDTIEMSAVEHHDDWWPDANIEYFFDCVQPFDGRDSGWISEREWTVSGLAPEFHRYVVFARDGSGIETLPSTEQGDQPGANTDIPQGQFSQVPNQVPGALSATMTAADYTSLGLEPLPGGLYEMRYEFAEVSGSAGGDGRAYSTSRTYTDGGLAGGGTYSYQVRMGLFYNDPVDGWTQTPVEQGESSDIESVVIAALPPVDTDPPNDPGLDPGNPLYYTAKHASGSPANSAPIAGRTWHVVTSIVMVDDSDLEYKFVNTDNSTFSSGNSGDPDGIEWRNADNVAGLFYPNGEPQVPWLYWADRGISTAVFEGWQIFVRDRSPNRNQSVPSEIRSINTSAP